MIIMYIGYKLESLMNLITLDYPANQFEANQIVIQVFDDLEIDILNLDYWICKYVELVEKRILYNSYQEIIFSLSKFKDLYIRSDFNLSSIKEFYLLYYGVSDLEDTGVQRYHDELTAKNIKEIVSLAFVNFRNENCKSILL